MQSLHLRRGIAALAIACLLLFDAGAAIAATPNYLPNAKATPGLINPLVTQKNIHSTICVSGYSKLIRPLSSYTTKLKIQQLSSLPYSRYGSRNTRLFEEDHLISLELGGNPTSSLNLWPEPFAGPYGARIKDKLENKLHDLVCSGQLGLVAAQQAEASNWYAAYLTYVVGSSAKQP